MIIPMNLLLLRGRLAVNPSPQASLRANTVLVANWKTGESSALAQTGPVLPGCYRQ